MPRLDTHDPGRGSGNGFLPMICGTCNFVTDRMLVKEWHSLATGDSGAEDLASVVRAILTPPVTRSLPESWQGKYTIERASEWIEERDQEGATLLVMDRSSGVPIGLMILFESDDEQLGRCVRIGYLLAEPMWGRGLASELLNGFVHWCRTVDISSILGGVERDNVASQRVLAKNGFEVLPTAEEHGDLLYVLRLE